MVAMEPTTLTRSPSPSPALGGPGDAAPFDLSKDGAYGDWRAEKLSHYPAMPEDLLVPVADPTALGADEKKAILERCRKFNMALYATAPGIGKKDVLGFAGHFGLTRFDRPLCTGEDGVTEITVVEGGRRGGYIPYSDKPLSWHTDGYYNKPGEQVRGILLHCRRAAEEGGVSELLDHEIAYIRLRDENPDFIRVLMEKDVLTIPANEEDGTVIREARTGPVFSVIKGRLHMRYTDRKRYMEWKDDALVVAARAFLKSVLEDPGEHLFRWRLTPGQGLICNNVLHRRTGFSDPIAVEGGGVEGGGGKDGRLIYRARFLDRVSVCR